MAGEPQSVTAEKRGHLNRTVSVISEAVEDEAGQEGESSESLESSGRRRPSEALTPSQSAPEISSSQGSDDRGGASSPKHDSEDDANNTATSSSGDSNTVTRVFLYEVVSGIRLSCLAEEDGSSVSGSPGDSEKKPRRHKHHERKKNRATSLRQSHHADEQLDAVFSEHNPEPFLTAEENPVPRATITLEAEAIAQKHGLQAKEFRRNSRWLLKTQPTETGERLDVEIKTYAATIFHRIRVASGVSTDEFCKSWNYTFKDLPQMHTGAGRSGSLFLASSDGRFFFKTLPYVEVQTLLDILPAYFDYITEHPESRLMRVFNILRFSDPRRIHGYLYLIVFPNAFYSPDCLLIHEKYDLKGRVPKPGKEGRHTLDNVDPVRYVFKDNDITSRRYVLPATSRDELAQALTNDVHFLQANGCMDYSLLVGVHHLSSDDKDKIRDELVGGGQSSSSSSSSSSAAGGLKPKKHRRKRASPPSSSSSASSSSTTSDAQPSRATSATPPPPQQLTLAPPDSKRGHRRSRSSDNRGKPSSSSSSAEPAPLDIVDHKPAKQSGHRRSASQSEQRSRRKSFSMAQLSDRRIAQRYGMLSSDGKETYFISIIDFLARYTMAKKGAHFFKTFLWTAETLSTVPPDYYGDRWLRAMLQCFPPGGEDIADPHLLSPVGPPPPASTPRDEDD